MRHPQRGLSRPAPPRRRLRQPRVEPLEPRRLLAGFVVNNAGDEPLGPNPHQDHTGQVHDPNGNPTGRTTLRSAITQLNIDGGSISFQGGMTITVGSALDPVTAPGAVINGGKLGTVVIRGGGNFDGLALTGGGATVTNLVVDGFGGTGIAIRSSGNTIRSDRVGTDASGRTAVANGYGVSDTGGSKNVIRDCVVSGNTFFGVWLRGSVGDTVAHDMVGTDPDGKSAVPNGVDGVYLSAQASKNTVGGTDDGSRNIISGNGNAGVYVTCQGPDHNTIEGNYIGVDVTGASALGNGVFGVEVVDGSQANTIGGTSPGARNIISGNLQYGVGLGGNGTNANFVDGNYIGTDVSGSTAIPNGSGGFGVGVLIGSGASGNVIGGVSPEYRNVISGNAAWGASVGDKGSTNNLIAGNYIGTDVSGKKAVANGTPGGGSGGIGVVIAYGATGNVVGGTTAGAANVISGNTGFGVRVRDAGTSGNKVQGNVIGTDSTGSTAIPNGTPGGPTGAGVAIANGATANTIGGTDDGALNVISGNAGNGVEVDDPSTSGNLIEGNVIGTDRSGNTAVPNGGDGVLLNGDSKNTVGGGSTAAGNVISGNNRNGVHVSAQNAATRDRIAGNRIGVGRAARAIPNGNSGVFLDGAGGNTVGGTTDGEANVISGNTVDGVLLAADGATGNTIEGDYIGTDPGFNQLPNGEVGVFVNAVPGNRIGSPAGATGGEGRNVIELNAGAGVQIDGSGATGNTVAGNDIFLNGGDGVVIHDASGNFIGEPSANGPSNRISGNTSNGVHVNGTDAKGNAVVNNLIGASAADGLAPNAASGILIEDGSGTTIGGNDAPSDNIISGNGQNGITITGNGTGNRIERNSISDSGGLGIDLGNDGITPVGTPGNSGPNQLQNYPVLNSVTEDEFSGDTIVQGFLRGTPGRTYRIQFYANAALDAHQLSEGQVYVGSVDVTVDGTGRANIDASFPQPSVGDQYLTATATDPDGNTSEFSPARDVLRGSVHYDIVDGYIIEAYFRPTVDVSGIAQAAAICGVDHFNWLQAIVHVPADWSVFTFQDPAGAWHQLPTATGHDFFWPAVNVPNTPISPPLIDPFAAPGVRYGIHSDLAAAADPVHFPAGDLPVGDIGPNGHDAFLYYYNEGNPGSPVVGDVAFYTNAVRMYYSDEPRVFQAFYSGGADSFMGFETTLAGVFPDHTGVLWRGIRADDGSTTAFRWRSNAAMVARPPYPTLGGVISPGYMAVYDGTGLPPVSGGSVTGTNYSNDAAPPTSDLLITPVAPTDPFPVGRDLFVKVTVTNTAATTATGVTFQDMLPAGFAYVFATSTQGTISRSGRLVTANVGTLAPGATDTVTLHVIPGTQGVALNGLKVSGLLAGGASTGGMTNQTIVVKPAPEIVPSDFDGARRSEMAVFRPSSAQWIALNPSTEAGHPIGGFGAKNLADIPVPGDYDGTGHTEMAVFRPSTGQWFVMGPNGGHLLGTFGAKDLKDIPVPGDYDGIGRTEMAVFRPSTGQWFVMNQLTGMGRLLGTFGAKNLTDLPVPGDYDGTGHTEMAVFRPSTGQWFVMGPKGGRLLGTFGAKNLTDLPVPGDYDGVGHAEMAVFRPSTAQWFVMGSGGGRLLGSFGAKNLVDLPTEGVSASLGRLGKLGDVRTRAVSFDTSKPSGPDQRPTITPPTTMPGVVFAGPLGGGSRGRRRSAWEVVLDRLAGEAWWGADRR